MTRFEKMGIDPTTKEGLIKLFEICPVELKDYYCCPTEHNGEVRACTECVAQYLLSEVPIKTVKRWETYNGDFVKAWSDYSHFVGHKPVTNNIIFACWLMQDMEVEE